MSTYEQYDSEESYDDLSESGVHDREISLGTTTVLGIFLALALVCALFFGFGYSMGRRSVPSALANVNTGISPPLQENRLTPGSLAGAGAGASAAYVPPTERSGNAATGDAATHDAASGAKAPSGQRTKPAAATTARTGSTGGDSDASVAAYERQQVAKAVEEARPETAQTLRPGATNAAATAPTAVPGSGSSYVQVTAISAAHRPDAEMLVGSLRRKGYAATIRPGTADQLLHVQLGPFATKKEAEAMRQRLSADGYNSILK